MSLKPHRSYRKFSHLYVVFLWLIPVFLSVSFVGELTFTEETAILYTGSLERKLEEKWVLLSAETKQMLKQWEDLDLVCPTVSSLLSLNN